MKNLNDLGNLIRENIKAHSPTYLSAAAAIGTLTTAYFTGRASYEAALIIKDLPPIENRKERLKEKLRVVWKLYVPAGISAASTITCIIGANSMGARKLIAAQTALAFSERAYSEYRDQVVEEYGARKDQSFRDKVAEKRIGDNPPPDILVSGPGNVLCCEMFTMRYFTSDMETLKKSVNELNARLLKHDYATLDDWYYIIGLVATTYSGEMGWKSDKLMELDFTTLLTPDGRPCLAFDYNYTTSL